MTGGMNAADDRRPYDQVAAIIRRRISVGEYRLGSDLPSIPTLAAEFGVANSTIAKAEDLLKDEGYLEPRVGSGVGVRSTDPLVVSSAAYIEPAPGRFSYELIDVAEVVPPSRVLVALGGDLDADDPIKAILRHRMMRYNARPVELSWSYYPALLVRGTALARRAKIRGGAPAVLADLGYPQRTMVDRISIRPPDPDERVALELPKGISVLQQFRIIRTDGDLPVEVSILVKGGHQYELENTVPVE